MRNVLLAVFSHRLLAIARWDLQLLRTRTTNALTLQPWRIRRFLATRATPVFLNLGSGPRGRDDEHWVNVDGFPDRHVHFQIDFLRPLPFPDDWFDGVFCEHVLEHFSEEEGESLLREAWRITRPGGCLRVIVPDAELILRQYFDNPAELVARRGASGVQTPMTIVNSYFRQRYEHQFLYDWVTLKAALARAGFRDSARVTFGEARRCPSILLDDRKYEWESLYAEAAKA